MSRGIRSDDQPNVTLRNVKVKRSSEKALLIVTEKGEGEEIWLPKSQLRDGSEDLKVSQAIVSVTMSAWIAGEKGITGDDPEDGSDGDDGHDE